MATLRSIATGTEICLGPHTSVGRAKRADVHLSGAGASKEHASIRWDGAAWTLQDLSRNGTSVSGRLLVGQSLRLHELDEITFGDPSERWQLTDGSAPQPLATRADGQVVRGQNGVLLLPNEDDPIASLYQRDGAWEIDSSGEVSNVDDGQSVHVGGFEYRLELPQLDPELGRTVTVLQDRSILSARIVLQASSDEEHVSVWLESGSAQKKLPDRTLNYMLLLLARARQTDAANGVAADDSGWSYADEFARQLDSSIERLNVDVHRVRRAVGHLRVNGVPMFSDADRIIERRRTTTQLRLGVANIRLQSR